MQGTSLTSRQQQAFSDCWSELDPHASRMIPHADLAQLVLDLPQPLGFGGNATYEDAVAVTRKLKVRRWTKSPC